MLVADDDPVSLRFLEIALGELGCSVRAVADGNAALAAAAAAEFDLMVLDRRMPGLGGAELLRVLRGRGIATPAIATSADLDEVARAELAAAGFATALPKPLRVDDLARSIGAFSRPDEIAGVESTTTLVGAGLLDDARGLAAVGGDRATLLALRALLANDLAALAARSERLDADLSEDLHRLRAACCYCGATALERAAHAIESTIRGGGLPQASDWSDFIACCDGTRIAIAQEAASV
ncbi:MAG: response regulator [Rudaea sp.]